MLNPEWGQTIWALITFGIAAFVLVRYAFGPLQAAIDARRQQIQDERDAAESDRAAAAQQLEEYRATLEKVRTEADEILDRSRKAGDTVKAEIMTEARTQAERVLTKAHDQIERDTRAALQEIKLQVADLTLMATEKVTAKSLNDADHERLIAETLASLDFEALGLGSQG